MRVSKGACQRLATAEETLILPSSTSILRNSITGDERTSLSKQTKSDPFWIYEHLASNVLSRSLSLLRP